MARPLKRGLSYFPKDVDFYQDMKVVKLAMKYGPIGLTTFEVLLTMIYREGYFIRLSISDAALIVVRTVGDRWYMKSGISTIDFASEIILYCAEIGLLDKALVKQEVMTSVGIQRRYAAATVKNKVKITEYRLLENDGSPTVWESAPKNIVSAEETPVSAEETPVSAEEMPQRKEKKSKVNKRRSPDDVSAVETQRSLPSGQSAAVGVDSGKTEFVMCEYARLLPSLPPPSESPKLLINLLKANKPNSDYTRLFEITAASKFLTTPKSNWKCDIEWLTEPAHMENALAGKYDEYKTSRDKPDPAQQVINGVESGFDTESFFEAALKRGSGGRK